MRLFSTFPLLAVIVLGVACAGPEAAHQEVDGTIPEDNRASPEAESITPPKRSFTNQVLNDLLVAELARQRDRIPMAVSRYLDAAIASRDAGVAEQATRMAIFAKDQKRALEAVTLWKEIDSDSLDAKRFHAALSIRAGHVKESIPTLQSLLDDPGIPSDQGFTLVGGLLGEGDDKEAALAAMEHIIAPYDDDPDAQFAFARFLVEIGEKERAADLFERVIAMGENNPLIRLYYAQFLQDQGKTAQAMDILFDALKNEVEDKDLRIGLARLLISEKRYEEAREQFEQLISADPEAAKIRYVLALFLLQIEQEDEARKHFLYLADQGKFMHEAHFNLGRIAESRKDLQGAMDLYRQVEDGQHYLDAQIHIADLLARQKKVRAAREHLHGVSPESAEESIRLYRMEGLILIEADELEEAMSVYGMALGEHPEDTELLYDRAMLAGRMDRVSILEQDLRGLLSQKPDHVDALNALGYTLADQTDRHQEAMALIQRAMALRPNSHYILDSMGWVLYRLGRHQEAMDYLQRALALRQDAEVAAHLGEVLWVTGDRKAARDVWNKAIEESPNDERLLKVMRRFGVASDRKSESE
uniref:Tetratricopeptide repeat-containing protein n=1 Tax=Candidatus Kentrum sp. SD TaxID=2126332 RepID=A0A450Y8Z3_9GAMM|nr:MAG: Tetratricopeptide repeat-containing protein [Candidatus Kentron sp. SD]VFK42731.1 MAG: Tetratricopeptide repeat-containing protein [Candidatus Kentron sp. SD]